MRKLTFLLFCGLLFIAVEVAAQPLRLTSLPNPNVYPIFIIIDQGYLDAEFVPARGGVSSLAALLKAGKADLALLNQAPARQLAKDQGWQFMASTITRAVHLLSYSPLHDRNHIDSLTIISAFPGGSPDKVFSAGNFSVTPRFTDPFLAIQLFLKKDFNALLLPEPYISQVAQLLRDRGDTFTVTDMQVLCLGRKETDINAGVALPGVDLESVRSAFLKAGRFIHDQPRRATDIIAAAFAQHFHKALPEAALAEALTSGRLQFVMEKSH